jgi:hypothetical protein
MKIKEAVEAAHKGLRVLMCYDTEDECVNDIKSMLLSSTYEPFLVTTNMYRFDSGGSIRFLTIRLNTSEHWGDIHFQEGNELAREIFPGCFENEL